MGDVAGGPGGGCGLTGPRGAGGRVVCTPRDVTGGDVGVVWVAELVQAGGGAGRGGGS